MSEQATEYAVCEDRQQPGDWRVEGLAPADAGECQVTIFTGADAEERAQDYAVLLRRPDPCARCVLLERVLARVQLDRDQWEASCLMTLEAEMQRLADAE